MGACQILLILLELVLSVSLQVCLNNTFQIEYVDLSLMGDGVIVDSLYACVSSSNSLSVMYHIHDQRCYLIEHFKNTTDMYENNIGATNITTNKNQKNNKFTDGAFVTAGSTIYGEILSEWSRILAGPCALEQCPFSYTCHVDRQHMATCVFKGPDCGDPPSVAGARLLYDREVRAPRVAYTCEEDFIQCRGSNISVCQPTGQWSAIDGLCQRFRWHRPTVHAYTYVPCEPHDSLNVRIHGKPTAKTRVTFNIKHNETILLLQIDFRLGAGILNLNCKKGKRWGVHKRIAGQHLIVGKWFDLDISWKKGVFRIVVNGAMITEYLTSAQSRDLYPKFLETQHDVHVSLVEYSFLS